MRAARNNCRWKTGLIVGLAVLWLGACAPRVEKREFAPAKQSFETRQIDVDLGLAGVGTSGDELSRSLPLVSSLTWEGDDVSSAEILRAAERMLRLGRRFDNSRLEEAGERLAQLFYRAPGTTTRVAFEDSLYIQAVIGETQTSTAAYIDGLRQMLIEERNVIHQTLEESRTAFDWPVGRVPAADMVAVIERYLNWLVARLDALGVDERVVTALRSAAQEAFAAQAPEIRTALAKVVEAPTTTFVVKELKNFLVAMEIELDPSSASEIARAARIGASLDAIKTPQDALSMIIEFWTMIEPSDREARFGSVSPSLYEFLSKRSSKDLECLRRPNCGLLSGFLLVLKKHLGVLPQIEEFGVEEIKAQLDEGARQALIAEIEIAVTTRLPEMLKFIRAEVDTEFNSILTWLADIRRDIPGFIRGVTARWANAQLTVDGRELVGIESTRVNVRWKTTGLEVSGRKRGFETGGEVLGSSLALASERLARFARPGDAKEPVNLRLAIAQLNKMLAIGGFVAPNRKPYRSYSIALDAKVVGGGTLNLRSFLDAPYTYGVLDRFGIDGAFDAILPPLKERVVGVRGQAELLRGFAGMIVYLRDWEVSGFDHGLGAVKVGDYVEGVPSGSITEKLFPKDMMFALALGNAAVLLQNMTKDLTPVFLTNLKGESVWSNAFGRADGDPSTMAGLVDLVGGSRRSVARTEDIARFGLALLDLLDALEGVQDTKSPPLIEGVEPNRPIDHLIKQLPELKNLVIGISNFLARHMQAPDGGMRSEFDRQRGEFRGERRLIDQALAIQMLTRSARVLDVKAYGTAALEAYFFMNRRLWRPDLRFYMRAEGSTKAPTPDEALTVFEAVEELSPLMGDVSRTQWENLSRPWLEAFSTL